MEYICPECHQRLHQVILYTQLKNIVDIGNWYYTKSSEITNYLSLQISLTKHVTWIGKIRNAYKTSLGKPEVKRPFGKMQNIKMDFLGNKCVKWLRLGPNYIHPCPSQHCHLSPENRQYGSPEHWHLLTNLHGSVTHISYHPYCVKTSNLIFTHIWISVEHLLKWRLTVHQNALKNLNGWMDIHDIGFWRVLLKFSEFSSSG